jgi:Zn-dependent peptidase ImmA (M78 family)
MPATMLKNPIDWMRRYQDSPPIDVHQIATDLGLKIWEFSNMSDSVSGKLYRDHLSPKGWSIGVNANNSSTRKRFTIAHELGHFLLHRDFLGEGVADDEFYRSEHLSGAQETEANKFAADLLMPYHLLQNLAPKMSVENLAKLFKVSEQALKIRLGIPLP